MKLSVLLCVFCVLGLVIVAFADEPMTSNRRSTPEEKEPGEPFTPPGGGGLLPGEDISSAIVIPGLAYSDTGNTCDYLDDYDEVCPYSGSTAPDVVYAYTPASDVCVTIDLCFSYYDTKVYVYENDDEHLVCCNDDACSGPNYPSAYLSRIQCLPLTVGNTYYIVVDGYGDECGTYILNVYEHVPPPPPCEISCPSGAIMEAEPGCFCLENDTWNGGCNSEPPVFQYLDPSCFYDPIVVCGKGAYDGNYRDTDWYQIDVAEDNTIITFCCTAEFGAMMAGITPLPDCSYFEYKYIFTDPCTEGCIVDTVNAGSYWLFVGVDFNQEQEFQCGWDYVMTVDGYNTGLPSADQGATWGTIKSLYK
jgi:hypothetical protein